MKGLSLVCFGMVAIFESARRFVPPVALGEFH
jgi:hypothetical protein